MTKCFLRFTYTNTYISLSKTELSTCLFSPQITFLKIRDDTTVGVQTPLTSDVVNEHLDDIQRLEQSVIQ